MEQQPKIEDSHLNTNVHQTSNFHSLKRKSNIDTLKR